jgi:hypothetical protein
MTKLFQGKDGGVPFPRTTDEWLAKGYSPEQAQHKMRQDVFGHDYQTDAKGNPIETGRGSASQPTAQHKEALERAAGARAAARSRIGFSPSLEGAFNPKGQ